MKKQKVFNWNLYVVSLTNRKELIRVCAPSFISAIKKVNQLISSWDDKDKYSIVGISFVSPCLN